MVSFPLRVSCLAVLILVLPGALLAAGPKDDPPKQPSAEELVLAGKYPQVPKGADAHGQALWAFARYYLAPNKDMYDAAWAAHQKGDALGSFLVMLCHQEGRAVRYDEALMFKLNFALRSQLSKKEKPNAIECYILSHTNAADAEGVLDLTKVEKVDEFKKAEAKKQRDWMRQAWDQGFVQAGYELARKHQKKKEYKEAFDWFDKTAAKGLAAGFRSKGFFLIEGLGVDKDIDKGFAATHEGAKGGDVFAMASMGFYYGTGLGTKEDEKQSKAWIEKAALTGHWMGYLEIAQLQLVGKHGFVVDKKLAMHNLQRALKTRNRDVLEVLTQWYALGRGVEVDGNKAIKYGEAAFVQGSENAAVALHAIYKEGIGGVAKNEKLAQYWGIQANPNFAFAMAKGLEAQHPELTKHLKNLDPWSVE